jgi:hypothetical protein
VLPAQAPVLQTLPHAPQFEPDDVRSVSHPFDGSPSQSPHPVAHVPTPHLAPEHDAVATWAPRGHACPQAPQLLADAVVSVSQPLAALPSQSPNPALQTVPQRPDTHAGAALASGPHALPQAPQFIGSWSVFVQAAGVPQATSGDAHDVAHAPLEHIVPGGQTAPHAPQLFESTLVVAQYGVPASVVHNVCAGEQELTHCPPEQLWPLPQATPHPPQLALSLCSLAQ